MSKPSKEERERIRKEWQASERGAHVAQPSEPEPFVITRTSDHRASTPPVSPTVDPAERQRRREARLARAAAIQRPPLNISRPLEETYGRTSMAYSDRMNERDGTRHDFVEAAIQSGQIRPKT